MFYEIIKFIVPFSSIILSLIYQEIVFDVTLILIFFTLLFSNVLTLRYNHNKIDIIEYLNPIIKAVFVNITIFFILFTFFKFNLLSIDVITYYLIFDFSLSIIIWFFSSLMLPPKSPTSILEKGIIYNSLDNQISDPSVHFKGLENKTFSSISELSKFLNIFGSQVKFISVTNTNSLETDYEVIFFKKKINTLKNIDSTLESLYSHIKNGGILITVYDKLEDRYTSSSFNYLDYFQHSFFPTIPYMKFIYKFFSRCKNRILSTSEIWGRLHRQGFEISSEKKIQNSTLLISYKKSFSLKHIIPSYSPLISLDRVGKNGNLIKIHKIRSMYPYSEFNQKKVFELNSLDSSGKFNDDFRITPFGDIIRKYWIDELPQIIDWFRGNIKIVGIRAMSQHYFSLYPERYKMKYNKVKPGFVSPIFDENTSSFDDIVKTEEDYLDYYLEKPLLADTVYFFSTVKMILFGGVKGG